MIMVSDLNAQIEDAQAQVEANQQKIADNQVKIDETTDTVNSLKEKLKNRIEDEQSTMHVSSVIDLLMGAKTFDQFLRIINCLSDITKSDSDTMTELTDSINELNTLQDQLKSDQETLQQKETDLEDSKTAITDRQAQLVAAEQQLATMVCILSGILVDDLVVIGAVGEMRLADEQADPVVRVQRRP